MLKLQSVNQYYVRHREAKEFGNYRVRSEGERIGNGTQVGIGLDLSVP